MSPVSALVKNIRELNLLAWSLNFKTKIISKPELFGLTLAQATAHAELHDAFANAMAIVEEATAKSAMTIDLRSIATANLVANVGLLTAIVQRAPTTTNQMRIALGIPELEIEPTRILPPAFSPRLAVVSVSGRVVRTRLIDVANPTRLGRPFGISGASVLSYVGAESPRRLSDWVFQTNTSRMILDIAFDERVPDGATVWISASYFNRRNESGPIANPVCTTVGEDVRLAA